MLKSSTDSEENLERDRDTLTEKKGLGYPILDFGLKMQIINFAIHVLQSIFSAIFDFRRIDVQLKYH